MSRNQIRIEIVSKTPFAGGISFGSTGPYERLLGTASFAIDPNEKDLPFICDLEFAPRNPEGLVEFKTVLDIVKPVDMSRGNRKLLFDFSNRGGRGVFTRLNDGGGLLRVVERQALRREVLLAPRTARQRARRRAGLLPFRVSSMLRWRG